MKLQGHQLLPKNGQILSPVWVCECDAWERQMPAVGGWGTTTRKARMGALITMHHKHLKKMNGGRYPT